MAVDQCYLFPVAKVVAKINERQRNAEPHGAQRKEGSEGHLKFINTQMYVSSSKSWLLISQGETYASWRFLSPQEEVEKEKNAKHYWRVKHSTLNRENTMLLSVIGNFKVQHVKSITHHKSGFLPLHAFHGLVETRREIARNQTKITREANVIR